MAADHTTYLQGLLDRIAKGDQAARQELVTASYERLRRLAKVVLRRDYPRLGQLQETGDVLHEALLRLVRALGKVHPPTVRDYFGLSASLIRRTLIDLARSQDCRGGTPGPGGTGPTPEPADSTFDPARLAEWAEFHQMIDDLAPRERELIDLLYYQGVSQREAAQVMGFSQPTVQRLWVAVRLKLAGSLA
jgi:RNA polymerase sigma-70 factor (ECF subfamily)